MVEERSSYPIRSTSSEALKSDIMADGFSSDDDDSDSGSGSDSGSDDDAIKVVAAISLAAIVAGGAVALAKYLKKRQQRS